MGLKPFYAASPQMGSMVHAIRTQTTTLSYFRTQTHRIRDTNDLVYSIEETKPGNVIIN